MNDSASAGLPHDPVPPLVRSAASHPVLDAETQQFLDLAAEAGLPAERLIEWANGGANGGANGDTALATPFESVVLQASPASPAFAIRIVRPPQATPTPLPAVLYLPGSGWSAASRASYERLALRLATEAEAAVALVEYTSAPVARFPIQIEQAFAALLHLDEHARALNLNAAALAVAGEGAGGHLAAALALLAKARRGPHLALQILLCPILSASAQSASAARYADGPGLTARALRMFVQTRFPVESLGDKFAMPLNANIADLEDLPPALIVTAENDVARDDAESYARKLMLAGVRVSALRCLGTIHDFTVLDGLSGTPPTEAALRLACDTIRATLRR